MIENLEFWTSKTINVVRILQIGMLELLDFRFIGISELSEFRNNMNDYQFWNYETVMGMNDKMIQNLYIYEYVYLYSSIYIHIYTL